jgi:hypothetical protein
MTYSFVIYVASTSLLLVSGQLTSGEKGIVISSFPNSSTAASAKQESELISGTPTHPTLFMFKLRNLKVFRHQLKVVDA